MKITDQEKEIKKRVQVARYYEHGHGVHGVYPCYRHYVSKCPFCGYVCEVPESCPSLLVDVCIHYDHTEGPYRYAIYKAAGAAGSVYVDPFERR